MSIKTNFGQRSASAHASSEHHVFIAPSMGLGYFLLLRQGLERKGWRVSIGQRLPRRGLLMGRKLDAVHIHMLDMVFMRVSLAETGRKLAWFAIVLVPLMRLRGTRLVWTCHEFEAHEFDPMSLMRRLSIVMARLSDVIIVHNTAMRDKLREHAPENKIILLPHGDLGPVYAPYSSEQKKPSAGHFTFASIGFMRPKKGNDIILRAFRRIARPDVRLVMRGRCLDDEYRRELEKIAAADPRVELVFSDMSDSDIAREHLNADVIVFAFRDCPTSGSVVTALSLGCAVIAPFTGHVKDLINDEVGWTFDPNESEDGLLALMEAATDRETVERKGIAAKAQMAQKDWAWDNIADKLSAIYLGANN